MDRIALCLGLVLLALGGCKDRPPPDEAAADAVDLAKVASIVADFHVEFFDAEMNNIELNDAERAIYFARQRTEGEAFALQRGDVKGVPPAVPVAIQTYTQRCRAAGVPIFPPWKAAGWRQLANLPLVPGLKVHNGPEHTPVEVWQFTAQTGVCIALPRKVKGGGTEVGFICQNRSTGKACFWAMQDPMKKCTAYPLAQHRNMPADRMCDGDTLRLNCTTCHRGKNVFNVHPNTSLAMAAETPATRYMPVPVSRANPAENAQWENLGTVTLPNNRRCGACHDFSTPTKPWCDTVLRSALGQRTAKNNAGARVTLARTMPVDFADTLLPAATLLGRFKPDLRALTAACAAVGVASVGFTPAQLAPPP